MQGGFYLKSLTSELSRDITVAAPLPWFLISDPNPYPNPNSNTNQYPELYPNSSPIPNPNPTARNGAISPIEQSTGHVTTCKAVFSAFTNSLASEQSCDITFAALVPQFQIQTLTVTQTLTLTNTPNHILALPLSQTLTRPKN